MSAESILADSDEWSWRSNAYAWWVVIVLTLGLTLSLMDRMIIALMIGPIKHDMGLSDTQISLLQGLAFTILYVTAGLPLGRLADRWSRRSIAGASVVTWSVMTAVCGGANSFGKLFVARLGVGIGEAGLSPAAVSLISDYFPKHKRARPLAFLSIGSTAGAGLAMMFGGAMVQALGATRSLDLPLVGSVKGWQAVFILLGAFGALFGAVFFTVREPSRREVGANHDPSVARVVRFLWERRRFFAAQFLGPSLAVLTLIAFHSWFPTLFIRRFGWNSATTGLVYGGAIGLGGTIGILLAGWAAERVAATGATGATSATSATDATLRVAMMAAFGAIVPMALSPLMPSPPLVVAMLFLGVTLMTIPSALAPAVLQSVCPNEIRGQIFAIYLLIMSTLGYTLGPLSVALITDRLLQRESGLNISLAIVAAVCVPLSALCLAESRRAYRTLSPRSAEVKAISTPTQ
jgi:MFS family permease